MEGDSIAMSDEYVDNRIVSMEFDNNDFEKRVSSTRKALASLTEDLKFKGLEDGAAKIGNVFSGLQNVISKVSFSPLHTGIDAAGQKFTVLESIAFGAFERIGGKIADTATKLVKSFTIDDITAGFSKYEKTLQATQTILAAIKQDYKDEAEAMEAVTKQLEFLTWYTDETSYNMTDMVDNISKFTGVGIKLEDASLEMIGIANACAQAGSGAQAATHAMEGFSKAMGQGYMSTQIWNNQIKTSGLGNVKAFKDELIKAAVEVGTLRKKSEGLWETAYGKEVSATDFTTALTEDKWLSGEVMELATKNYAKSMPKLFEEYEKFNGEMTTSEILANETFTKSLDELSVTAFKLGQEATTFTQAMDATHDAMTSRWKDIYMQILGDYTEARVLWTNLANWLYDIVVAPMDTVLAKVTDWANAITGITRINEKGEKEALNGRETLVAAFNNIANAISNVIEMAKGVWSEVFGGIDTKTLTDLTVKFYNFSEKIKMVSEESENLKRVITTVFKIIKTVFSYAKVAFNTVWQLAKPILEKVLKIIWLYMSAADALYSTIKNKVAKGFDLILKAMAKLTGADPVDLSTLTNIEKFQKILDLAFVKIESIINLVLGKAKEKFEEFKTNFGGVKVIFDWILQSLYKINGIKLDFSEITSMKAFSKIEATLVLLGQTIKDRLKGIFGNTEDNIKGILDKILIKMYDVNGYKMTADDFVDMKSFDKVFTAIMLGLNKIEANIEEKYPKVTKNIKRLFEFIKNPIDSMFNFIYEVSGMPAEMIKSMSEAFSPLEKIQIILNNLFNGAFFDQLHKIIEGDEIYKGLKSIATTVGDFIVTKLYTGLLKLEAYPEELINAITSNGTIFEKIKRMFKTFFDDIFNGNLWKGLKANGIIDKITDVITTIKTYLNQAADGIANLALRWIYRLSGMPEEMINGILANLDFETKIYDIVSNILNGSLWDDLKDTKFYKLIHGIGKALEDNLKVKAQGAFDFFVSKFMSFVGKSEGQIKELLDKFDNFGKIKFMFANLLSGVFKQAFDKTKIGILLNDLIKMVEPYLDKFKGNILFKIKDTLSNAWKLIKSTVFKVLSPIGKFLSSFMEGVNWESLFKTRYLVHIFDEILDAWAHFKNKLAIGESVKNLTSWIGSIGKSLGAAAKQLNGITTLEIGIALFFLAEAVKALASVDADGAKKSVEVMESCIDKVKTIITTVSAISASGNAIGGGLGAISKNGTISSKVSGAMTSTGQMFAPAFIIAGMGLTIKMLAEALEVIAEVNPDRLEAAANIVAMLLDKMTIVIAVILGIMTVGNVLTSIFKKAPTTTGSTGGKFAGLITVNNTNNYKNGDNGIGENLKAFALLLGVIIGGFALIIGILAGLSKMKNGEKILDEAKSIMSVMFGATAILMMALASFAVIMAKQKGNAIGFAGMTAVIFVIGLALTAILNAMALMILSIKGAKLDANGLKSLTAMVGVLMGGFLVLAYIMTKAASDAKPFERAGFLKGGKTADNSATKMVAVIGSSLALIFRGFAKMLKQMKGLDETQMHYAMGMVAVIMTYMLLIVAAAFELAGKASVEDSGKFKNLAGAVKTLLGGLVVIILATIVVMEIIKRNPLDFITAFGIIALIMAGLTLIMYEVSKMKHTKNMSAFATSCIIFAGALVLIAGSIAILDTIASDSNFGKSVGAMAGLIGGFIILAAIISALDKTGGVVLGMIGIAAACLIFSLSVIALAGGLMLMTKALELFITVFNNNRDNIIEFLNNVKEQIPIIGEIVGVFLVTIFRTILQSIVGFASEIADAIVTLIVGIGEAITNHIPELTKIWNTLKPFVQMLIDDLFELIFNSLTSLTTNLINWIDSILVLLTDKLPNLSAFLGALLDVIKQFGIDFMWDVSEFVINFVAMLDFTFEQIKPDLENLWGNIIDFFLSLIDRALAELDEHLPDWAKAIVKLICDLIDEVTNGVSDITDSVEGLLLELADSVVSLFETGGEIIGRLSQIPVKIFEGIFKGLTTDANGEKNKFGEFAGYIIDGIKEGIGKRLKEMAEAGDGLASTIASTFCKVLDINSPSGLFEWFAEMCVEGFNKNQNGNEEEIGKSGSSWGNTLKNSVIQGFSGNDTVKSIIGTFSSGEAQEGVSGIGNMLGDTLSSAMAEGINTDELTITPVLDLSNVEEGAGSIGDILRSQGDVEIPTILSDGSQDSSGNSVFGQRGWKYMQSHLGNVETHVTKRGIREKYLSTNKSSQMADNTADNFNNYKTTTYTDSQLENQNDITNRSQSATAKNGGRTAGGTTYIQNNYSPKALSRTDIYRQTRNQLNFSKGVVY